jgi:hypothetical protein
VVMFLGLHSTFYLHSDIFFKLFQMRLQQLHFLVEQLGFIGQILILGKLGDAARETSNGGDPVPEDMGGFPNHYLFPFVCSFLSASHSLVLVLQTFLFFKS